MPDLPPFKRAGLLSDWELSPAFDAGDVDASTYPASISQWEKVHAEDPGFVLVNRYRSSPAMFPMPPREEMRKGRVKGAKVVFARTQISSVKGGEKILKIGYSDDIVVYLNRQPIFSGRMPCRTAMMTRSVHSASTTRPISISTQVTTNYSSRSRNTTVAGHSNVSCLLSHPNSTAGCWTEPNRSKSQKVEPDQGRSIRPTDECFRERCYIPYTAGRQVRGGCERLPATAGARHFRKSCDNSRCSG